MAMAESADSVLAAHKSTLIDDAPSKRHVNYSNGALSGSPIDIDRYIPLGTLSVSVQHNVADLHSVWEELDVAQIAQLNINIGKQLIQLTAKFWIRVFAKRDVNESHGCFIRVYLLPDDVGRVQVPRASAKLRSCMRTVLESVNKSPRAWTGDQKLEVEFEDYRPKAADDDSLFYIFNTLESPRPMPDEVYDEYAANAMQDLLECGKAEQGLNTDLYQYQRRSCAKMIQRETQPELRLDPRLETMIGPTNEKFYLDRNNCEILTQPRSYHEARGGILAETMGFGKTLICLATVIATKGRIPETPPEYSASLGAGRRTSGPRSLFDTCGLNIAKNNTQWRLYFQERARGGEYFDRCSRLLEKTIGRYEINVVHGRGRRAATSVQTMCLASTSLIIVPPNLLKQWQRQIHQHVRPGILSVLQVDDPKVSIEPPEKLRFFDLVLMSSQRFEEEMFPLGGNRGSSDAIYCTCSEPAKRRFCQEHPYRSPLRDVHFLRVIVDEGQRFVSGSTTQAIMALKALKVDAKWIVSGTPAGGLVGAEVDLAAEESFVDLQRSRSSSEAPFENGIVEQATNGVQHSSAEKSHDTESAATKGENDCVSSKGAPSKLRKNLADRQKAKDIDEERKSIERLGHIVKSFLRVQPWANEDREDGANWNAYVAPNKNGTRKPLSLRSVLGGLVIRHQYDDVERDLRLPPLDNKLIRLRPCFFDKLSLNLFLLSLTANAVTSERKDQDYMFHSRNRKSLEILIRNLRHAGFTWSGFTADEIEKTCSVSQTYLEKEDKVVNTTDRSLLERAISVGFLAQYTPAWKAFNHLSEIGLFVGALPDEHKQALTLCPAIDPRHDLCLIGATQLCSAQEAVEAELYSNDIQKAMQTLGQAKHNGVPNHDKKPQHASMLRESPRKSPNSSRGIPQSGILEVKKLSASQFSNVTVRMRHQPLTVSEEEARLAPQRGHGNSALRSILRTVEKKPDVPPAYPLVAKSSLVGTSSAKLSYLIDKVYGLYKSEKILIFYEGDDIAFYCAQVFDLLGIPHLIYARGISQKLRNEYQTMFNTGSIYRVLLMDLKQAALGLHMAIASRVFFINPVWQPAIEAQAIKRAHRIGQTRPVFVETLVLEGTIEEQMLQRRKSMSVEEHQKAARSLLDDTPMKDIIQNATLLTISPEEINDHALQFAPLSKPQQLFARSIVSAYGSHKAVLEALQKAKSEEVERTNLLGLNGSSVNDSVPPSIESTNRGRPRPGSKKRKMVFVDELERRKVALGNENGPMEETKAAKYEEKEGPLVKRRRSSKITFADERDLPLSTTIILPDDEESATDAIAGGNGHLTE